MSIAILGLGSNCGDRMGFLRKAVQTLGQSLSLRLLRISPIYQSEALLPDDAPSSWNQPFLNLNICCETDALPHDLLIFLKKLEGDLGRQNRGRWAPREIDIDILAIDSLVYREGPLKIPHPGLLSRPFALVPFADLLPGWKFPIPGPDFGSTAAELVKRFDKPIERALFCLTEAVGVINVTPDSFSDGGRYLAPRSALSQADRLIARGIHLIDLGAESTRPGATAMTPEEEWARLEPVLKPLISLSQQAMLLTPYPAPALGFIPSIGSSIGPRISPKISIDTRHPETVRKAIQCGVHWINDVSGFENPKMIEAVAESSVDVVVMHSLSVPPKKELTLPNNQDVMNVLLEWGNQKILQLKSFGIHPDRIILDPGIGFGKTAAQSWEILRNIRRLKTLGTRTFVGHSRKSFLSTVTDASAEERDLETVTISIDLIQKGVDYLRIHNAEMYQRCLKSWIQSNGICLWNL